VEISYVEMDRACDLCQGEVLSHVVQQIGEHGKGEGSQGLVRSDAVSEEDALVQEHVNLGDKEGSHVGREDVPRGDEELLSCCGRFRGAVLEELDDILGHVVLVRSDEVGVRANNVGEERDRLDLRGDEVAVAGTVSNLGGHVGRERVVLVHNLLSTGLQLEGVHDQVNERLQVGLVQVTVQLEEQDDDDGALCQDLYFFFFFFL